MRAIVLSGGGPLATAWEAGLLAGLARGGLRLDDADLILGTSAGAIVGAHVALGADPDELFGAIQAEERGVLPPGASAPAPAGAMMRLPELFMKAQAADDDHPAARAEVGAYALSAATEPEAGHVARVSASLPSSRWPKLDFGCVAVNALTGEAVILNRDSGADLGQAVAASCSLPGVTPPIFVGGRPYIDGGLRSTANADLARGCARLVVVAYEPGGGAGQRIRARLDQQLRALTNAGAEVRTITPDAQSQESLGPVPGDVTRRPALARAGAAQGAAAAAATRRFWIDR